MLKISKIKNDGNKIKKQIKKIPVIFAIIFVDVCPIYFHTISSGYGGYDISAYLPFVYLKHYLKVLIYIIYYAIFWLVNVTNAVNLSLDYSSFFIVASFYSSFCN